MDSITLLGHLIEVDFMQGEDGEPLDRPALLADLGDVATMINGVETWDADERLAFTSLKAIVFFTGSVLVNTHRMDRPCCDEDDAVFYWEVAEFNAFDVEATDLRAHTLFHDSWHVVQYRQAGHRFARDSAEQVEREQDATRRQIKVARKLDSEPHEIDHLIAFAGDPELIVARIDEGQVRTPTGQFAANAHRMKHVPGALSASAQG